MLTNVQFIINCKWPNCKRFQRRVAKRSWALYFINFLLRFNDLREPLNCTLKGMCLLNLSQYQIKPQNPSGGGETLGKPQPQNSAFSFGCGSSHEIPGLLLPRGTLPGPLMAQSTKQLMLWLFPGNRIAPSLPKCSDSCCIFKSV